MMRGPGAVRLRSVAAVLAGLFVFARSVCAGLSFKSIHQAFVAAQSQQDKHSDDGSSYDTCPYPAERTRQVFDRREIIVEKAARHISQRSIDDSPDDATGGIKKQEFAPGHVIDSRQEGCPGAQDGDEATKEDGFVSMSCKESLRVIQVMRFQKDIFSITQR